MCVENTFRMQSLKYQLSQKAFSESCIAISSWLNSLMRVGNAIILSC